MLKIALRGILAHKFRLFLTVVAVFVSVAFMTGTQVLTGTLSAAFDKVFDDVYKDIDAVVRSSNTINSGFGPVRDNVDGSVIPAVREVDGVEAVEGQIRGIVTILDKSNKATSNPNAGPPTFGLNWLSEPALNGWYLTDGSRPPAAAGEVVLDELTAEKAGYRIGDTVRIQTSKGVESYSIVGTGGFGSTRNYAGSSAALFNTEEAQRLLAEPGKFTWINVAGADGVTQAQLQARIAGVLPPGDQVITGDAFTSESQDVFRQFLGVLGTALFVFGLVALIVGAFIIYNTFSIIVAQRTRELALLRATGAGRGQILGSVTTEALLTGLIASGLGILGGIALGWGLVRLLAAAGSGPQDQTVTVTAGAVIASLLTGTIVTTLSGLLPAWRASRVPPVAAMRDVAIDTGGRTGRRFVFGALLSIIGAGLMYAGLAPKAANPVPKVGFGVGFVFFGVAALLPLVAAPVARVIGAPLPGITGRLARANAQRNPRRTATTASALMIGVGLVVLFSILTQSVKTSIDSALTNSVTADFLITSGTNPGQGGGFDPSVEAELEKVPGVGATTGLRFWFAQVNGKPTPMFSADPTAILEMQRYEISSGSFDRLDNDTIGVGVGDAEKFGWKVGDRVEVTFLQGGAQKLEVGAIFSTGIERNDNGLFLTPEAFGDRVPAQFNVDNLIFVKAADGTDPASLKAPLSAVVEQRYPTATVQTVKEYGQAQAGFLDVLLIVISALLFLAILIALIGIINTLLLSVYERTRELGLLRAVGTRRSQVSSTVRWESVIIALLGTLVGMAIGFLFAWALVTAIGRENPITLDIPWTQVVALILVAGVAGVLAAIYPAFKASRLDVLKAIATE